jgi:multidrug resistance protein MdtO
MGEVLLRIIKQELAPFEGRLHTALCTAAVCSLSAMVFMVYGIPLVAIGCYLVLFVMKPNISESLLMAIGIIILLAFVVLILFALTRVAISHEIWRMVILAMSSFLFLYLGASSKLGPIGGIIALVIAFIMTLLGMVPIGEIATRGILFAWLMATVPMAVLICFNVVFGPSPRKMARRQIAERLQAIGAALLDTNARHTTQEMMREGNEGAQKTMMLVALFALLPKQEVTRLKQALDKTYLLLTAVMALPPDTSEDSLPQRQYLSQYCNALADCFTSGAVLHIPPELQATSQSIIRHPAYATLADLLHTFADAPPKNIPGVEPIKEGFFYPDAKTNRTYTQFAFKTTLSAIICYFVYTVLQWQDIHTAMVTCYVAALSTTGETTHKLTLRICGCLIGAAIGIASILFLIPHMTSIGELMLLVFAGTLIAAWVSSGSERSSYAGVQIGLAFLLTVLQGFGPDVKLDAATDRIIGILLGNFVLYLVFTRLWPVSATQTVTAQLQEISERLIHTMQKPAGMAQARADMNNVVPKLNVLRNQLILSIFEPDALHRGSVGVHTLRQAVDEVEDLYLKAAFSPDNSIRPTIIPAVTELTHTLSVATT